MPEKSPRMVGIDRQKDRSAGEFVGTELPWPLGQWFYPVTILSSIYATNIFPAQAQASHTLKTRGNHSFSPKIHVTTESFTYDDTSIPEPPNCMMMTPPAHFLGWRQ